MPLFDIRHSDFVIHISLGFRISPCVLSHFFRAL